MNKPKSVGYHIQGCKGITMVGNRSYGADIGFQIIDSPDSQLSDNFHYSAEAMRLISEVEKALYAGSEEIKQNLGEDKLNEIINIVNDIKVQKQSTPLQLMERLYSAGANTLTLWPLFKNLLDNLT